MHSLTKNKAELLRLFITNPERSYYVQEIGRILGMKPGVFQRTLNTLAEEGILKSEFKANARYFCLNSRYPLLREIKSILGKTLGVEGKIKEALDKFRAIQFAFVYGSFARNKIRAASDIDLMIIGTPDENVLIAALDPLEKYLQREINYTLYSPERFKADIRKKNPFLLEVLKGKKTMLIGSPDELRKMAQNQPH